MSKEIEQIEEEQSGDMSFLRGLNENKLFRNKSDVRRIDHETSRNLLFLNTLALYALSQEAKTADWAQGTASRASAFNNFDIFKIALNDIYNLAHIQFGETSYGDVDIISQMKKNPMMQQMYLRFLRGIGREQNMDSSITQTFLRLEKALDITNGVYRVLRREVSNWNQLGDSEKKSALKRLYRFTKALSPRSEVLPIFKQHIGHIEGLSKTQKVALGVGVFTAGALAGYHMAREKK